MAVLSSQRLNLRLQLGDLLGLQGVILSQVGVFVHHAFNVFAWVCLVFFGHGEAESHVNCHTFAAESRKTYLSRRCCLKREEVRSKNQQRVAKTGGASSEVPKPQTHIQNQSLTVHRAPEVCKHGVYDLENS